MHVRKEAPQDIEQAYQWNITCPFDLTDNNAFKAIELAPGGLQNVSGTVVYSKKLRE